jgi:DNA-binding MarR family transcriptional regulator
MVRNALGIFSKRSGNWHHLGRSIALHWLSNINGKPSRMTIQSHAFTLAAIRKAVWASIPYLDGKKDFPLRHYVVLLFIMEKGETTSPDIQEALKEEQPAVSSCVRALRGLGLVIAQKGSGAYARRDMLSLTESGKALLQTISQATK